MRIIHVANFNTGKYGTDLYATDRKISAGLTRNGHFVYDFSYRDICRNESLFRTTRFGRGKVNNRLLHACAIQNPDLLLLGHSELIEEATLAEIRRRQPHIRIGLWYIDALFHKQKTSHILQRLPCIDVVFATTGGQYLREWSVGSTTAAFIPNMVDQAVEMHRAFAASSYDHDFIFCGRDDNDPDRQAFMFNLRLEASRHLRCAFRGCLGQTPLAGSGYLDFLGRSKMGLNMSRRNDLTLYSSDRLAQLLGNGLLTFCPRVPGLTRLFAEDEIVYFDGLDDLLEKIIFYHTHDRECRETAERGWRRIHRCCGTERVCRYMLDLLFARSFSEEYEWRHEVYSRRRPVDRGERLGPLQGTHVTENQGDGPLT